MSTMHRLVVNAAHSQMKLARSKVLHGSYSTCRRWSNTTTNSPPGQGSSPRNTGEAPYNSSSPLDLEGIGVPPTNFARPTLTALDFWWRFAKFSFIGIAFLAGGTFVAFEGAHYWVEHIGLANPPDPDGELERWGWLKDAERWTGGAKGGTDSALGRAGRYALRSAWIAQNWGTGTQVISSSMLANAQQKGDRALEASLEFAHDFYSLALTAADKSEKAGKPIRPETIAEILVRKAAILERVGSKGALYDARETYERVWDRQLALGSEPEERARLALKLGDVSARLGNTNEARVWWAQALRLVSSPDVSALQFNSDTITTFGNARIELPKLLPDSPHAQRTLAAILSSLSAYYAQSGQLSDAKSVEDAGIALLAPPVPSTSSDLANQQQNANSNSTDEDVIAAKPAPQALHELYLQHRLSLLALHRAEVNHALHSSSTQTLEELAKVAIEAEDVVFALSASSPTSASSSDTPVHRAQLDETFTRDRVLKSPANSLLRDARRTALHAWTLSGILHENAASTSSSPSSPKSSWKKLLSSSTTPSQTQTQSPSPPERKVIEAEQRAALRCYTRALAWAGVTSPDAPSSSSSDGQSQGDGELSEPSPSRDILPGEWKALWEGYTRTREAVIASATSTGGEKKP